MTHERMIIMIIWCLNKDDSRFHEYWIFYSKSWGDKSVEIAKSFIEYKIEEFMASKFVVLLRRRFKAIINHETFSVSRKTLRWKKMPTR